MSPPEPERVSWPRFEVIETRLYGEGRARYVVMDYLTKSHRFPLNPYSKDAAGSLLLSLRQEAQGRGEPVTVLRLKGAVNRPPQPKRERPEVVPRPKGGPTG